MWMQCDGEKAWVTLAVVISAAVSGGVGQAQVIGEVWQNQSGPAGDAELGFGDPTSGMYLGAPDAKFNAGAISVNSL